MQRSTTAHIWQMLDDTGVRKDLIAEYLGINPSYLADLRKAHVPMSVPMMDKISALLGLDKEALFADYVRGNQEMKQLEGKEK